MRSAILAGAAAPLAAMIMGCPMILGVTEPTTVDCLTSADCGAGEACAEGQCAACPPQNDCMEPPGEQGACSATPKPAGEVCAGGVCDGDGNCGACAPDQGSCDGVTPLVCGPDGRWAPQEACAGATPRCVAGACAPPPSCDGLDVLCGTAKESCCAAAAVPDGWLLMGRGEGADYDEEAAGAASFQDEVPEHATTLSTPFSLDVYTVTVGRFRRFVDAYDVAEMTPAPGAGAKPGRPESGWDASWDAMLPTTREMLLEDLRASSARTWTDVPGNNETRPIVNVTWYEAFAFCVWDGGRLPSEQEWEYAAAGGEENTRYPWGSQEPDSTRAVYDCGSDDPGCAPIAIAPVGSRPDGQGIWGHLDLVGNAYQWVLDSYDPGWYTQGEDFDWTDPVNVAPAEERGARGGSYEVSWGKQLRSAARWHGRPAEPYYDISFRCAR